MSNERDLAAEQPVSQMRSGVLVLLLGYGARLVLSVLAPRLGFVVLSAFSPRFDPAQVNRELTGLAFMMSAVMFAGWVVVARAQAWRMRLALAAASSLLLELGIGVAAVVSLDVLQHPAYVLGSAIVRFSAQGLGWLALLQLARIRSVEVQSSTTWFFAALGVVFVLATLRSLGPWSQLLREIPALLPISTISAITLMVIPTRLLWKLTARSP